MNSKAEQLIDTLSPAIDKKCAELKAARKIRLQTRLFVLLCAAVVTVPALLIFFGVSLTVLIAPVVFMSLSVIVLLPILISGKAANERRTVYE